jgi:hypothetical protein
MRSGRSVQCAPRDQCIPQVPLIGAEFIAN